MRSLLGRFHRPNARSQSEQLFMLNNLGDGSTLSLDFTTGVLDPRLTFTRSTTGTYINSSGYVTSAAINAPRFDYDPTTPTPRGLLIEGAASNLATNSNLQAGWLGGSNTTVTANTSEVTSPDGTNNAAKIALTNAGYCSRFESISGLAASTAHTFSYWIRGTAGNQQRVYSVTAGADLVTQTTLSYSTTGWTRVQINFTTTAAISNVYIYVASRPTGTASDVIYVYGCQLEVGTGASSLIPTGASTGFRAVDFCTMPTASFIPGNPYPQTLFVDCIPNTPSSAFLNIARIFDRTASGAFSYGTEIYYYNASTMTVGRKITASTNTDRSFASGLSYGTRHKFALSIDASSYSGSYDGVTALGVATAPTALATVATHLGIGCTGDSTASSVMFGTIRQIKFYPTALSQSAINTLTTL
jgi:hypothetical protein